MTPTDATQKARFQHLVEIFSPVVFFDPKERFFPVDLPSTVAASSLYRVTGKPYRETATVEKARSAVLPLSPADLKITADLKTTAEHYFTTVADRGRVTTLVKDVEPPLDMPSPLIDTVYDRYVNGAIPAQLTMYVSVCTVSDLPNYHFMELVPPFVGSLSEAILLSYYFYFPALETEGYRREGDWSGISLLFPRIPNVNAPFEPKQFEKSLEEMKILACYFRKDGDKFIAGPDGFRSWEAVTKHNSPSMAFPTHPVVYISLGLHNCYDRPTPLGTVAPLAFDDAEPAKIEKGGYAPSPPALFHLESPRRYSTHDIEYPPWLVAAFPFLILTSLCAAGRVENYGRAIPPGRPHTAREGGYKGSSPVPESGSGSSPASDRYPPAGLVPIFGNEVSLHVQYVDFDDSALAAIWQYPGSWGAAEVEELTIPAEPGDLDPTPGPSRWGKFGGCERPILPQWFLWNLYFDKTFGCGGGSGYV